MDMKLVSLFLLLGAVSSSNSVLSNNGLDEYWQEFKRFYEKSYSTSDENDRREIWEKNVDGIIQHNLESDMGKHTYRQGLNEYSDMDDNEFLSKMNGLRSDVSRTNGSLWIPPSNVTIPERLDWRDEVLITIRKRQRRHQEGSLAASSCGSGSFPCGRVSECPCATGACPCGTGDCPCGQRGDCPCGTERCPCGTVACPCGQRGDCPCGTGACPCGTVACVCGSRNECPYGSSAGCPGRSRAARAISSCPCGSLPNCPCNTAQCRCGRENSCPCGSLPACPCGTVKCVCGKAVSCPCGSLPACPWGTVKCPRRRRRSLAARNQLWTEKYQFVENGIGANCTGFVDIPSGDEEALKQAVATVGPISATIDSSGPGFRFYKNGVYDEPTCGTDVQNHVVLIVGYGALDGVEYWLVQNSWGDTWGVKGYIMMSRNKNNQCGIATKASYSLV